MTVVYESTAFFDNVAPRLLAFALYVLPSLPLLYMFFSLPLFKPLPLLR